MTRRNPNHPRTFTGRALDKVAFPMGGMGAGMICLEGTGGFSHVSIRHKPEVFHEPMMFAALAIANRDSRKNVARVLEGPVPPWKVTFPWGASFSGSANGSGDRIWGLPRMRHASFSSRFPFGTVTLSDEAMPVVVNITGWSPFVPGDSASASLPVAGIEYTVQNVSSKTLRLVLSLHTRNFVAASEGQSGIVPRADGYTMWQKPVSGKPWLEGAVSVSTDAPKVAVCNQWFRGGWFDTKTMLWRSIARAEAVSHATSDDGVGREGGSLFVPLEIPAGQDATVRIRLSWYVPASDVRAGYGKEDEASVERPGYRPWYAAQFAGIDALAAHWRDNYRRLREESHAFTSCFFDSTLPGEVLEAIAANLTILKSPTVLRQADGRLWGWEGSCDGWGCCHGSCTHVWNYAQAVAHLFPDLERTLRDAEFGENQDTRGHQNFRSKLPIVDNDHGFHAAADGQLGGIMKVYRDWRIGGDTDWLRAMWPKVRASLDYCIATWDPRHTGVLEEPHHNTYDIEFWGPDGMCTSFYLGALAAAVRMAEALGSDCATYRQLQARGRTYLEKKLYNGRYFEQKVVWRGLNEQDPVTVAAQGIQQQYSPEALELLENEGPKYQYGTGCLADGVLGAWMAQVCGIGEIIDRSKARSHLQSVCRYNFKKDLSGHVNPQRPSYALNDEAGLVLCTWPRGGALTLPFPYSDEVWTGVEYQVASHLMSLGEVDKGLEIVRAARGRYDGRVRNPFDEYECGHWYARALSSYAMLQGMSGVRYDAVERTLYVAPAAKDDMRCFVATAGGYGTVVVRKGVATLETTRGTIPIDRIVYNGKVQRAV